MELSSLIEYSDYLETLNISESEKWKLHLLRKDFGKQLIKPGMFFPCDEEGKILEFIEKPVYEKYWSNMGTVFSSELYVDRLHRWKQYNDAQSRMLFKGFKWNTYSNESKYIVGFHKTYLIRAEGIYDDHNDCAPKLTQDTIEHLLNYNTNQIELTETAIKILQPKEEKN